MSFSSGRAKMKKTKTYNLIKLKQEAILRSYMRALDLNERKRILKEAKKYDCPNCFKLGASFVINIYNEKSKKGLKKQP